MEPVRLGPVVSPHAFLPVRLGIREALPVVQSVADDDPFLVGDVFMRTMPISASASHISCSLSRTTFFSHAR
jgi:hypothetical protein